MKKVLFSFLIVCFLMIGLTPQAEAFTLRFATFSAGSGWHIMGETQAEIYRKYIDEITSISVLPYTGGIGNCNLLHQGEADIAHGFGTETQLAMAGEWPYEEEMPGLRALVGHLDTYWYAFAIRADTGITSMEELKEKEFPLRLAVLTPGSSGDWLTQNFLSAHGMSYDDIKEWGGSVSHLSFAAAADAVRDGRAHAFGQLATPGHPTWTELAATADINFIPISDEAMEWFKEEYGYVEGFIPEGEFGVDEDVPVIGFYTMLLATEDLPEEIAYQITKVTVENKEFLVEGYSAFRDFDPERAWDVPVPLHEGALRYYREMGYID